MHIKLEARASFPINGGFVPSISHGPKKKERLSPVVPPRRLIPSDLLNAVHCVETWATLRENRASRCVTAQGTRPILVDSTALAWRA